MTDHSGSPLQPGGIDSEIDVRRLVEIAAWLAAIVLVSVVIGYFLYKGLGRAADRQDPAPSPLAEAQAKVEPPAPRLQLHPESELRALRAANAAHLSSWGWVDESAGFAHIPIDLAIDQLAVPEPDAAPNAGTATPPALAPLVDEHTTAEGAGH